MISPPIAASSTRLSGAECVRKAKRIDIERAKLQELPDRRTSDYEQVTVRVTCSGGFTLRKVFYTVPSRLIGHRLRVRLYDDRLDVFIGGSHLMTPPAGGSMPTASTTRSVNYRHVIHSLRRKPMALPQPVYRDQPSPAKPIDEPSTHSCSGCPKSRPAASWSTCSPWPGRPRLQAELADLLAADLEAGRLPDMSAVCAHFAPDPARLPHVVVHLVLTTYEDLLGSGYRGAAA